MREALWRLGFDVPYNGKPVDTLTWQYCAIDAATNKTCLGPFSIDVTINPADCGDGVVQMWETCDDDGDPLCVECQNTCGKRAGRWVSSCLPTARMPHDRSRVAIVWAGSTSMVVPSIQIVPSQLPHWVSRVWSMMSTPSGLTRR